MKILGINFSRETVVRTEPQAYSTPFMEVGKGNLALPFIQSNHMKQGVLYFGSDNLFPQLINQMYYTSPLHGAIVDFIGNAALGGSFELVGVDTAKDKIALEVFKRLNKMSKLVPTCQRDYYLHGRVHLLMSFSDSGKFLNMKRIEPSYIRYRQDGNFEYSANWATNQDRKTIESYRHGKKCKEMLYTYGEPGAGQDCYPIPTYSSSLNWCFLDGEQSFFHKNNIQNSIFPSIAIRRPKRFGSKKEIEDFTDGLTANQGSQNAGKVMVLTGDGIENVPEIVTISANNNDRLFEGTAKELKDNICFAHKINPAIMGIKVAGSLGNSEELNMSYAIFEKNVVLPLRTDNEELWNEVLQIAGISATLNINGYKIIEDVIIPTT